MYRDFVALVEPLDGEGNTLFKRLESPKHNELSPERITDADERKTIIASMKRLARDIRKAIRDQTYSEPEETEPLDELTEFFATPHESDDDGMPDPSAEDDPETFVYTPQQRRRTNTPKSRHPGSDDEGGAGHGENGDADGTGWGHGSGVGSGSGSGSGSGREGPRTWTAGETRTSVVDPRHRPDPRHRRGC